jgi:hypothetical protein
VLLLDLKKNEIRDAWFIGEGGHTVKVAQVARTDSFFYAATDGGLKKLAYKEKDGADFRAWQAVSAVACTGVPICK